MPGPLTIDRMIKNKQNSVHNYLFHSDIFLQKIIISHLAEKLKQREEYIIIVSCPKTARVRAGTLEPNSLSIALLDWTIRLVQLVEPP